VHDDAFPYDAVKQMGYMPYVFGQKAHYGVALLIDQRLPEASVGELTRGFATDAGDAQRRFIGVQLKPKHGLPLWVYNGYFPQGEARDHPVKFPAKKAFYRDLIQHLQNKHETNESVVVMGDMNIAPQDIDIGIGEKNAKRWLSSGKCSFLPEERQWYQDLLSCGLSDYWRTKYPSSEKLSWFDYRSRGFSQTPKHGLRIDQILNSLSLEEDCVDAGIDHQIRAMDKPSDHCPIWLSLKFEY